MLKILSIINNCQIQLVDYFYAVSFYKTFVRPILFLSDPEKVHYRTFGFLKFLFRIPFFKSFVKKMYSEGEKSLHRNIFGLDFENPVGLAAGLDKNGTHIHELAAFGFGFIEVGTVTPLAQKGNDKPRLFRLPNDEALINRMGFNNDGVDALAARLKNRPKHLIVGGNIGKNKNTPNERAIFDYEICFRTLFNSVDYFAVNVSSPNTPGLRALQEKEPLLQLLNHLQEINSELTAKNAISKAYKPILLKISPDLNNQQLDEIIEVVISTRIDGIIATNTTLSRENLQSGKTIIENAGAGGLSGRPVNKRSTEIIRYLKKNSSGRFKIIGAGGIHSPEDAREKLNAGADLIQIYTGFIYEGPALVKKILKRIE
jgi:dihydroorotate dehydrogenase